MSRTSSLRIGVIHARIKLGSKRANTRKLKSLVASLVDDYKVDLVVLPPYPFTGPVINYYTPNRLKHAMSNYAERIGRRLPGNSILVNPIEWAVKLNVSILVGPMIERAGPRLYITSVLIDEYGSIVSKYRKMSLTPEEIKYGINRGKDPGIFYVSSKDAKIGVFIDEDLAYPEVFRFMQKEEVNIVIGFMLPYPSAYFKMTRDLGHIMTMDKSMVETFLAVRSKEIGIPILLVGGIVEDVGNHGKLAYMNTIPVEPDVGVIQEKEKGLEEIDTVFIVDVDVRHSRALPLNPNITETVKRLCKSLK
ncbi:MAG: carbon-nitrogen hydrolase family protein [Desulfurococcales archaeon]|nr:carbon-nitrogen hydrolase family protein [Desulfurococcales archaeon]